VKEEVVSQGLDMIESRKYEGTHSMTLMGLWLLYISKDQVSAQE
jgi:hypothetical protein